MEQSLKRSVVDELYDLGVDDVYDLYGPSEDTTYSTYVKREPGLPPCIGKPIADTQCYILSAGYLLAPAGVTGELHLGGAGLARGYLNQPELTAEKFIANPFYDKNNPNSSKRLYKTGDLVRWLPDGNLEFLGRIDHQVKIRGFRIELGEIEHQLLNHNEVNDAVVVALSNEEGDKRLVAYVTHDEADKMLLPEDKDEDKEGENAQTRHHEFIESLRQQLTRELPDYMVPSAFVVLESLPLTPNGKVDRKGLPAPDMSLQQKAYVAPTTETEKVMCDFWQEVLGIERVGVTDNFFELGGHSLLAAKLIAQINSALAVDMPLKALFSYPTIALLSIELSQYASGIVRPQIIEISRDNALQTSFAQQRLWLLDKIEGGSAHYNMPGALRLTGNLDVSALNQAFNTILERHESLRTVFSENEGGEPIQVIQAVAEFDIPLNDLSPFSAAERTTQLSVLVSEEASKLFDLSTDAMLRAQLVKMNEDEHVLLVTMHHIASDGWSMGILINEFSALYSAYVRGEANPSPALDIQYADYAHWQRDWLQGEVLDEQLGYWKNQLAALPVVHSLPLDNPRPKIQTFSGATHQSVIPASLSVKLNQLCHGVGGTLFMGLHAAFSVLLARYSNETDIVVGSPIANREQAEVANLIGFFVNTLVLRSDLSASPSFSELVEQSKQMLLDAYAHQQVPFEQIVETLKPERSLSHSALFQVMLVLQNNEAARLELPDLSLSQVEQSGDIAKYDLTLTVAETTQGLQLGWEYNTDLFNADTVARLATHFELLLTGLLNQPENNVFSIDMLPAAEVHQQLIEWNDTAADFPKDKCIHELFEAQVELTPDAVAVVFEHEQLTYGELNAKANQLARYLIEVRQVTPDVLVGICIERSLEMIVGIMAILKAGGAYVPLDPSYPNARLEYMLADASLDTVLTQVNLQGETPVRQAQSVTIDSEELLTQLQRYSTDNVIVKTLSSSHLAYVIYTSGSTGEPKGVCAPHLSMINRLCWLDREIPVQKEDVFSQKTSISFVDHVAEVFQPLLNGCKLVVIADAIIKQVNMMLKIIDDESITRITMVPSLLKSFIDEYEQTNKTTSLKTVISSGESISVGVAERFLTLFPDTVLYNFYGSSEVAADVLSYKIELDNIEEQILHYFTENNVDGYFRHSDKPIVKPSRLNTVNIPLEDDFCGDYIPSKPMLIDEYRHLLNSDVLPYTVDVTSSTYIGHMTSKLPNFMSEISKLVSELNQNLVKIETSGGLTHVERQIMYSMHRLFFDFEDSYYGSKKDASNIYGVVTSGGSISNVTAMLFARNNELLKQGVTLDLLKKEGFVTSVFNLGYRKVVILGTDLVHYSIKKGLSLFGLGDENFIKINKDQDMKMSIEHLEEVVLECKNKNYFIISIIGIAGTTETGAVDPLKNIAAIALEYGIHFHVDAAWGGLFNFRRCLVLKFKVLSWLILLRFVRINSCIFLKV